MKKILLAIAAVLIVIFSFGQTGDPLRDKLDSIFKFVDKTQIPTFYLKEYGSEMVPLHWFKGVMTDSNFVANIDTFRFIYHDLATAKIQSALPLMTDLLTVNSTIDNLRNNANAPIVCSQAFTFSYYALYNKPEKLNIHYINPLNNG